MAEYIEREALIQTIHKDPWIGAQGKDYALCDIAEQPTADVVEVRHGKWLKTEEPMGWHDVDCIECSACHGSWVIADDVSFEDYVEGWKYCPNCGAKMDGKGEE